MERFLPKFILVACLLVIVGVWGEDIMQNKEVSLQGSAVFDTLAVLSGKATQGTTEVAITVDADGPNITIYNPGNYTYHKALVDMAVLVNDSAGVSNVYYNLNNGQNITLALDNSGFNNSEITAEPGSNILTIFANDTLNNRADTAITFSVNHTILYTVNWSKFEYPGSTNLSELNATQLEQIPNLTLVIPSFGKIRFNKEINLTNHLLVFGPTDLNGKNTVLTSNFIFINSTVFPNFNTTATLTLSNLTFINPEILRDSVACPTAICQKISYEKNELVFSVSHFSSYEAGEGGDSNGGSGGGSSGGGGGGGGGGGATSRNILGELTGPKVVTTSLYGRIIFTIVLANKPYDYSITIMQIERAKSRVLLRIDTFERIESMVKNGEKQEFDLDGDGASDIFIELRGIMDNSITLLIGPKREPVSDQQESGVAGKGAREEEPRQTAKGGREFFAPEKEGRNAIYLLTLMLIVASAIIIGKMMVTRKKGRKRFTKHQISRHR